MGTGMSRGEPLLPNLGGEMRGGEGLGKRPRHHYARTRKGERKTGEITRSGGGNRLKASLWETDGVLSGL